MTCSNHHRCNQIDTITENSSHAIHFLLYFPYACIWWNSWPSNRLTCENESFTVFLLHYKHPLLVQGTIAPSICPSFPTPQAPRTRHIVRTPIIEIFTISLTLSRTKSIHMTVVLRDQYYRFKTSLIWKMSIYTNITIYHLFSFYLFVWGYTSHSRIFHSYGEVTITGKRLQIFTYARHSWPMGSEGSFACPTYCDTEHPFVIVISEDP